MSNNMYDFTGWREVDCVTADVTRGEQPVSPGSTLTDIDGNYGTPVMFTEWWRKSDDGPVLRDYYWHPHSNAGQCVHYVPESR